MTQLIQSTAITGVTFARLRAFGDERGRFLETFRKEWFPQRSWERIQTNRSDSVQGVLRGLHYHFKQVDYWYVPRGAVRVALADLRVGSPTYLATEVIDIGDENQTGVFVPVGVAHGFYALTDVTLTYLVDNYYDGDDELGVAWNDPQLAIPWGADAPLLSARDQANPTVDQIPDHLRPRFSR